jgi:methyl-accepting chemotaxis protein
MSLRTKLLAVVVGLPGAILMLALLLFVRSEPSTPKSAIDRLVHLAAGGTTDPIGQGILRLEEQGHFAHIYVVRLAKSGDAENHPADAWTAKAYYAPNRGEADVTDPALLALLVSQLREASGPSPPFTLREDYVAVGFKPKKDVRASGIVAFLRSPLSDAKTVYWVIVTGLTVMMVFSYWMISRLVIGPLARLAVAADRIAEGDFGVDVAGKEAGDEVGRTIRALNRMAREIAEYQGQLEDRVLTALERIKKAEQHLTIAQRRPAWRTRSTTRWGG